MCLSHPLQDHTFRPADDIRWKVLRTRNGEETLKSPHRDTRWKFGATKRATPLSVLTGDIETTHNGIHVFLTKKDAILYTKTFIYRSTDTIVVRLRVSSFRNAGYYLTTIWGNWCNGKRLTDERISFRNEIWGKARIDEVWTPSGKKNITRRFQKCA